MAQIILADPCGFCGGVERALRIAEKELTDHPGEILYLLHDLVHNSMVSDDLKKRGGKTVPSVNDIPPGGHLLISAHGAAKKVFDDAAAADLAVIDATCPLVRKVQDMTRDFVTEGYRVLLFGHRQHHEVIGILGQCGAPDRVTVLENVAEAENFIPDPTEKYACLSQTTWNQETVRVMIQLLQRKIPALRIADSVCNATSERQDAVRRLAEKCDVVLIVGSAESSNTLRLLEIAGTITERAYLVSSPHDLTEEMTANAGTIGVASGASAPEQQLAAILHALQE